MATPWRRLADQHGVLPVEPPRDEGHDEGLWAARDEDRGGEDRGEAEEAIGEGREWVGHFGARVSGSVKTEFAKVSPKNLDF